MNKKYLGDALDWWKGGLLRRLIKGRFIRELVVVPCFSDAESWEEQDLELYADLLGVGRENIGSEIGAPEICDFFFDPDVGIQTGRVKDEAAYLAPTRLIQLLRSNPICVGAVYQHVRMITARNRFAQIVAHLRNLGSISCFCSYESASVGMLFASEHCGRIDSVFNGISEMMRGKALERVSIWRCVPNKALHPSSAMEGNA